MENNKKDEERVKGCIKKRRRDGLRSRVGANYFTPLEGPGGFVGSEVQPRRSAEDCVELNCAVVFYTEVSETFSIQGTGWQRGRFQTT